MSLSSDNEIIKRKGEEGEDNAFFLVITIQYQKCSLDLYTDFLVASQKQFSGAELARSAPETIAHDSVIRWLSQEKLIPKIVWQESQHIVEKGSGYLIIDDTVLDKPYAHKMALTKNNTQESTIRL